MDLQAAIGDILEASPCLPVATLESPDDALPLADALMAGGIFNIEITLRTPRALDAIRAAAGHDKRLTIGAGTVFTAEQVSAAVDAGARYVVSPGYSDKVAAACKTVGVPYLPGAVTATEIQAAQEKGFRFLKFSPAETSGGPAALKAFAPIFRDIKFCATGGITPQNAGAYFSLPNVVTLGMSFLAPADAIARKDWAGITAAARDIALSFKRKSIS